MYDVIGAFYMCVSEVYSVLSRCRSPVNINSDLHNIFKILKHIRILEKRIPKNAKKIKLNIKKRPLNIPF